MDVTGLSSLAAAARDSNSTPSGLLESSAASQFQSQQPSSARVERTLSILQQSSADQNGSSSSAALPQPSVATLLPPNPTQLPSSGRRVTFFKAKPTAEQIAAEQKAAEEKVQQVSVGSQILKCLASLDSKLDDLAAAIAHLAESPSDDESPQLSEDDAAM